jgi:hypothetical protein
MHLTFGNNFNQPIDHLPSGLTYICIGSKFDQPIDFLPKSIEEFGLDSNNKIINYIPQNVKNIKIIFNFSDSIVNNVPSHIRQIKISRDKINCLKKIPFDCKILDENDNEIFIV